MEEWNNRSYFHKTIGNTKVHAENQKILDGSGPSSNSAEPSRVAIIARTIEIVGFESTASFRVADSSDSNTSYKNKN